VIGPGPAAIALALVAAVAWGFGDFGGGVTSRRAPVLGVVLIVELVGVVLATAVVVAAGEPLPSQRGILLGLGAGVFGMFGILGLYRGLAIGRMGVVAPVAAVLGAGLPVAIGLVIEGVPGPLQVIGIALGILAVVLVSQVPGPVGGRSGIEFGIVSGIGIAGFNVFISQPRGRGDRPLAVLRLESVCSLLVVLVGRQAWRVPRGAIPAAVAVGTLDMIGNGTFIFATQAGALAPTVVVASLYPVVTILLAIAVLHERVSRFHAVGIGSAMLAVALIAAG
jgi:drug/metabolite transporter (DMT)-like permease